MMFYVVANEKPPGAATPDGQSMKEGFAFLILCYFYFTITVNNNKERW